MLVFLSRIPGRQKASISVFVSGELACHDLWLKHVKPAAETLNVPKEPLFPEQRLETKFACLSTTSKSGWRKALTCRFRTYPSEFISSLIYPEIALSASIRTFEGSYNVPRFFTPQDGPRRSTASNERGWLQNGARMSHTLLIFWAPWQIFSAWVLAIACLEALFDFPPAAHSATSLQSSTNPRHTCRSSLPYCPRISIPFLTS